MKILVVDDHVLFRQGLVGLLQNEPDFEVIGEVGSVREAVEKAGQLRPDMILMDFSLPDGNGVDAARTILNLLPNCKIIFLTVHAEEETLIEAIRGGAIGYLLKNVPILQLKRELRAAMHGEAAISRTMMAQVMHELARESGQSHSEESILEKLSSREFEVLRELTTGASNQEIAARLIISKNTVRHHIHNLLEKLGKENRNQLAQMARANGLAAREQSQGVPF